MNDAPDAPPPILVERRHLLLEVALGACGMLVYGLVFLWAYPVIGLGTVALSIAPVALAAARHGLGVGIGTALFMLPFHAFLFYLSGQSDWIAVLRTESLVTSVAVLVAGAVIGRFRDMHTWLIREMGSEKGTLEFWLGERKRAEEALRKSEERYRLLSDASREAVCLITTEGKFIEVNQAALDLFGYTREELLTRDIKDIYADPADREWLQRTLEEEEENAGRDFEVKIRKKDGTEVECLETDSLWQENDGDTIGYKVVISDMTWRRQAEEALRDGEERLRLAMEAAHMATWDMDLQTGKVTASETLEPLLGLDPGTFAGTYQSLLDHVHRDDRASLERTIAGAVKKKGDSELELRIVRPQGDVRWMAFRATVIQNMTTNPSRIIGTLMDITDRKKAEERVEHLGFYDPLTDLPNRRLFNDRITVALTQARRMGKMVAVLYLDLDRFKVINDTLGHVAGDRLLQQAAERLTGCVRPYDTVARQGGDEFMVVVPGIDGPDEVEKIAERILSAFKDPFYIAGRKLYVTTSIGISAYPNDGDGADPLLRNADAAMYRVKEAGRNGYQFHTPAMYAEAFGRLELEAGLRQGLERSEFVVYYQPVVDIRNGQIVGTEALVRWQDPTGKLVAPAEFIPLAEESGLIVPLGEWVLRTACAQNQAWQEAGLPPLHIAINISARQFEQANLVHRVGEILGETGLDPQLLKLEITESTAMRNVDHTIRVLCDLAEMGVQASLDDFGTGHASLNYLKDFPLHSLKIDRSFVLGLPTDPNDTAIATAVIALGHALNLEVIAEGVDTEAQLEFLRSRQCDAAQGYLFSRPISAEELAQHLKGDRRLAVGSRL